MDPFSVQHTRFIRDSRQAYGCRFAVEKTNRDYLSAFAGLAVFIVAVLVLAARVS